MFCFLIMENNYFPAYKVNYVRGKVVTTLSSMTAVVVPFSRCKQNLQNTHLPK